MSSEGEPPDPRSPRSAPAAGSGDDGPLPAAPAPAGAAPAGPTLAARTPFLDEGPGGPGLPPQRPNLGSMLFFTAFFFFMSSNNTPPPIIVVGPDGQIQQRVTTLDRARTQVDEYSAFLNGTAVRGNGTWIEGARPEVLPSAITPGRYIHPSGPEHRFYTNITGFHREASAHSISLVDSPLPSQEGFFHHVRLPSLNSTAHPRWNETLAQELRGGWDWAAVDKWEMNVKERAILPRRPSRPGTSSSGQGHWNETMEFDDEEWAWVRGTITLHAGTSGRNNTNSAYSSSSIDYDFRGLHHVPNGTYELFGTPDGAYLDLRNIPRLYDGPGHQYISRTIIMRELEKEFAVEEASLLLTDVRPDDYSLRTHCPLMIHLALPPIPSGTDIDAMRLYDQELRHPTGLLSSLSRPPQYWQHGGLGGVIVADQCGFAIGLEGGKGIKLDDFWRKSISYAAFATLSQLLVLYLLVRQMERTRTPSTLAKVSLWSIVMMGAADSWIFSAHVAVGTMSDNKTSLPLLVPGFLALCTAIVFGPRYAVMLYRVQAPERTLAPPPPPPPSITPPASTSPAANVEAGGIAASDTAAPGLIQRIQSQFNERPRLRWFTIGLAAFVVFQLVLIPSVLPLFLFSLYSFWLPQIWRNATRGSIGVDKVFVVGTSMGRLALPLYALGCPDNVFFFETSPWIFGLAIWQAVQITVLFAQERLGPSFFLPKSFAPAEGYNYHPLLPSSSDPEDNLTTLPASKDHGDHNSESDADRTCSICMEHVDTRPSAAGPGGEALNLLGVGGGAAGGRWQRNYALAPCGHLFHTNCLAQWLAIKTICPLCKRSLPPL